MFLTVEWLEKVYTVIENVQFVHTRGGKPSGNKKPN